MELERPSYYQSTAPVQSYATSTVAYPQTGIQTYSTAGPAYSTVQTGYSNAQAYSTVGGYSDRQLRNSHVIGVTQGAERVISETVGQGRVVNQYEVPMGERIIQPNFIPQERVIRNSGRRLVQEEPEIVTRYVDKPIEVLVERSVPQQRVVEVPYDVVVERPIERVIEKEVVHNKVIQQEQIKTIEVPVERFVDVPVEQIVEQPVEYQRFVDVPVERIVERQVDQVHENLVYNDVLQEVDVSQVGQYSQYGNTQILPTQVRTSQRQVQREVPVYRENIIRQVVDVPVDRIIEQPREVIVDQPVERIVERPVYVDNIINQTVERPVERIVEQPVEYIRENEVYVDNIIRRPVPVEVVREVVQEVPVERIVEQPVYRENIIERQVENPIRKEVIIEKERVVDVPTYSQRRYPVSAVNPLANVYRQQVPNVVETQVIKPIKYVIQKENPVAVETQVNVTIPRFNERRTESIIKKQVMCEVIRQEAVPVEKEVQVVVERTVENPIYQEVIEEKQVHIDKVLKEEYEVLVPRYVDVEVVKEIVVPKKTYSQNPVVNYNNVNVDKVYNKRTIVPQQGQEIVNDIEVEDQDLQNRIVSYQQQINALSQENRALEAQVAGSRVVAGQGANMNQLNSVVAGNAQLRSQLSELKSRIDVVQKDKMRMNSLAGQQNNNHVVEYTTINPLLLQKRSELERLVNENRRLVSMAETAN